MKVRLHDHFTLPKLFRFVLPSVVMMIFTSTYSVVDGFFVSNFAGKEALAAVNLVWPPVMIVGALGFIVGAGGSALVAATLGERKKDRARGIFTLLIIVATLAGIALAIGGACALDPLIALLGAEGSLADQCRTYGYLLMAFVTVYILQNAFQSFFVAAGRPHIGLAVTTAAGLTNIVGDYLFIVVANHGVAGAAWGTGLGWAVGGLLPLLYFSLNKTSELRFARPILELRAIGKTCSNGSSEFVTNIAMSVVGTLYNYQLMRLAGPDGVAAYSAIMYVNFVMVAVFFGYTLGTAPLISFNYGAGNQAELKNLFKKSLAIITTASLVMFAVAQGLADPLTRLFVGYDEQLCSLTLHGFRIYALSFLLCGLSIFGSGFFTALNNGVVSAVISFFRTLVFETAAVMLLPLAFGLDGVWTSIIVAEACATTLTAVFLARLRKRYGYA